MEDYKWEEDIFNLGDQQKEKTKKSAEELQALLRDYRTVFFSSEAGQRVFWDLLNQTYMFYPYQEFNASSYGKEGRRQMGLYLLAAVGFRPDPAGLAMLTRSLMNYVKSKTEGSK